MVIILYILCVCNIYIYIIWTISVYLCNIVEILLPISWYSGVFSHFLKTVCYGLWLTALVLVEFLSHILSCQLLQQNFNRVKRCIFSLINVGSYINSCFQWESPRRSLCAFLVGGKTLLLYTHRNKQPTTDLHHNDMIHTTQRNLKSLIINRYIDRAMYTVCIYNSLRVFGDSCVLKSCDVWSVLIV